MKAVFTHAEHSKYDDHLEDRYHFPGAYLNVVERAKNDWIVYYEPRRTSDTSAGGRQAYFGVARVVGVEPDPEKPNHYYARLTDYLPFANPQPFRSSGEYLESILRKADGSTNKGAFGRSVRELPDNEFDRIVGRGFSGVRRDLGGADFEPPAKAVVYLPEDVATGRRIVEQLVARPFRDAAFARQVKRVYKNTCAMTGLRLINGGGRPEVQAAHIRPVHKQGPDLVANGIALCSTAHWMFDRGLVSIDDDYRLLLAVSHIPPQVRQLLNAEERLRLPQNHVDAPGRRFLEYHRRNVFKG